MEMEQSKQRVAIVRHDETFNACKKAVELCEGFDKLRADHKVLLKPNILWGGTRSMPPYGRVTTASMVGYVLRLLRDHGCSNISIGEGTIPNKEMGSTTTRGFEWSGIGKTAKRYGAKLIDFNAGPYEKVVLGDITAKISTHALECDFLIDLPVLKTHRQTKISLGMKNLKGCLALVSKKMFHRHDLNHLIALLNLKVRPSLTIVDGIYGLEKGPDLLGIPRRMNLIIAGKDVFSCDVVGAMVMGIKPEEVDYLREFAEMTGRAVSTDGIEVRGERIEDVTQQLEWCLSVEDIFRQARLSGITIQDAGLSCCSGCAAILTAIAGILTKDSPGTRLDGVEVCMGAEVRAKRESRKVFLLGDCAITTNKDLKDAIRIRGCPPPILNSVTSLVFKGFPTREAAGILTSRVIKNVGIKLGVYDEAFPAFGICNPPEFNRGHFD